MNQAAETIGAALGHVAARLDAWKKEREAIAGDVRRMVTSAQSMLADLGETARAAGERVRRGGRQRGYKASPATRAKLRAAWQRRKAEAAGVVATGAKKGRRKRGRLSAEARERIAAAQRKRWAAYRAENS
ncbi:MAG TPA: hypothetical protein VG538_11350 [Vicinamibacterales bacterium]|nr:hypothetical protein [Vicinamibacterales bacterium]